MSKFYCWNVRINFHKPQHCNLEAGSYERIDWPICTKSPYEEDVRRIIEEDIMEKHDILSITPILPEEYCLVIAE